MSSDAIGIYNAHRDYQLEEGSFTEEFILDPSGAAITINGVFDKSYITDEKDQGNVRQQKMKPRILVSEFHSSIVAQTTTIEVRGDVYKIQKLDRDENGIPRMWLIGT